MYRPPFLAGAGGLYPCAGSDFSLFTSASTLCVQEGAGGRVGEQTEHLWSATKPFAKIARYMSRARWQDGFNLLLELLTRIKQQAFPNLISQKITATGKKLGTWRWTACVPGWLPVCVAWSGCLHAGLPSGRLNAGRLYLRCSSSVTRFLG